MATCIAACINPKGGIGPQGNLVSVIARDSYEPDQVGTAELYDRHLQQIVPEGVKP